MKVRLGQDVLLWIVWVCFLGILYYIGETQYYMTHLCWYLVLAIVASFAQVGIFWVLNNRKK